MSLTVGILYDVQDFLDYTLNQNLVGEKISKDMERFGFSQVNEILDLCKTAKWIRDEPFLKPTQNGMKITNESKRFIKLREQLYSFIQYAKPSWSRLLLKGRSDALNLLPEELGQIFHEAKLLESKSEDVLNWWFQIKSEIRTTINDIRGDVGLIGEKKTILYEKERVGVEPSWISLECESAGYDILSQKSKHNKSKMLIEVKTTSTRFQNGSIFITENEWTIGSQNTDQYRLYIWETANSCTVPLVLAINQIEKHIPQNRAKGLWQSCRIPIKELLNSQKYKYYP